MRRFLAALAIVVAGVVPISAARGALADQELKHRAAGSAIGERFEWPNDTRVANPVEGYRFLADAASASQVNLIRATTASRTSQFPVITYYIYLCRSDSALFDQFDLVSGRWLTAGDMESGTAVVTTVDQPRSAEPNRDSGPIGVPRVWSEDYELSFEPLNQAFQTLPMAGVYTIDSQSAVNTRTFLDSVRQYLRSAGVDESLQTGPAITSGSEGLAAAGGRYGPGVLATLFVVLATIGVARDGRRMGAMLLMGFSAARVWALLAGKLLAAASAFGAVAAAYVVATTRGADARLAVRVAMPLLIAIALGVAGTTLLAVMLARRVRIADLVKGRVS